MKMIATIDPRRLVLLLCLAFTQIVLAGSSFLSGSCSALPGFHNQITLTEYKDNSPALLDASLESLSEGLEKKVFTSVDLVKVSSTDMIMADCTKICRHILQG